MLKAGASPEFTSAFAAAYWTQCFLSVSNYRLNQGSDFTAVLDSYLLHPVFRFPQTGVELATVATPALCLYSQADSRALCGFVLFVFRCFQFVGPVYPHFGTDFGPN